MKVLVTRPREDAVGLARALAERGLTVWLEPLIDIVPDQDATLPLAGIQGFLCTSANGVRALAAALPANGAAFDLPLWAVGDATARTAGDVGFRRVESADGDVEALAALVARRVDARAGALLHATASARAGDLAGRLRDLGYRVRCEVVYSARPATALSPSLLQALDGGELNLAVFFSPRTAQTFVTLTTVAGRQAACRGIVAYALSRAVTEALAGLPWQAVRTAAAPRQDALLEAIDQDVGMGGNAAGRKTP
jgi:uroporphyrinogen-III synthase